MSYIAGKGTALCDAQSEHELLAACQKGDSSAFGQLVHRHQKGLYNIALRISGNEADAAEIVQDSFLAAWRKIRDFRGESRLSTWLTSITINQARTRWQQSRTRRGAEKPLDGDNKDDGSVTLQLASGMPSPFEVVEKDQLRQLLERCIQALDHGFREVLVLRDMRELAYDEVAKVLGLREGTVKSRLFRARDAVKDCVVRGMGRQ